MNSVYITSVGKFLPGSPVSNEEMEDYLGKIGGKSSKTKRLILEKNQIRFRYYAMDKEQKSLYTNAEMASLAIRDALDRNGNVTEQDIDFLATGTTRADLLLPGFASMVHAETGLPYGNCISFRFMRQRDACTQECVCTYQSWRAPSSHRLFQRVFESRIQTYEI